MKPIDYLYRYRTPERTVMRGVILVYRFRIKLVI